MFTSLYMIDTAFERSNLVVQECLKTLDRVKELLTVKALEYIRNDNPFHNFERGSDLLQLSRESVICSYMTKHIISIMDLVDDSDEQKIISEELIDEKINDTIAYLIILKAAMKNTRSQNITNL